MAPHLTPNQLARFEERLQRERARLLGLTRPEGPSDSPGLADPGDAADVAEEQVERSTRNTLTEGDRAQLAQVNRALLKLADGSYGLSDVTRGRRPTSRTPRAAADDQSSGSDTVTWTSTVCPNPVPARQ